MPRQLMPTVVVTATALVSALAQVTGRCEPAQTAEPAIAAVISQRSTPAQQSSVVFPALTQKWTGDLDGMIQRRLLRALVVHSKTQFFLERGTERGLAYEALSAFEESLNRAHRTKLKVHVVFIPTPRDELLPALIAGRGDLIVAGLTITPERDSVVDFSIPANTTPVDEIAVTGPESPSITSLDDLAGKEVFVRKSSSYWTHLEALNARFAAEHKSAMTLRAAPEDLEDEDLLEMLNAGLFKIAVVDNYVAELWAKVFPKLSLHPDVAVHTGGRLAWAFRPNSPTLKTSVDAFMKTHRQGTMFGNTVFRRYIGSTDFITTATSAEEIRKFEELMHLFRQYGDQYDMDYLLMMAQGYQESRLNHTVKSRVGAVGVMQLMPATGKAMNVGDIRQLEANIHAGVKYIRFMVDEYLADEPMDRLNKGLFAFASYNAGPWRVRELRKEAAKRGLNPNVWFNNVEIVAAERIGAETVTYVSNIYKYYIAYRMVVEDVGGYAR